MYDMVLLKSSASCYRTVDASWTDIQHTVQCNVTFQNVSAEEVNEANASSILSAVTTYSRFTVYCMLNWLHSLFQQLLLIIHPCPYCTLVYYQYIRKSFVYDSSVNLLWDRTFWHGLIAMGMLIDFLTVECQWHFGTSYLCLFWFCVNCFNVV